jgi:hypothetical protein
MAEGPPPKIPDLTLAQSLFILQSQPKSSDLYSSAKDHLLKEIVANSLAPLYLSLKDDLPDWSQSTYDTLKQKNDEEETRIDAKLKENEEMTGESEISDALISKFMFLAKIVDKVDVHMTRLTTGSRVECPSGCHGEDEYLRIKDRSCIHGYKIRSVFPRCRPYCSQCREGSVVCFSVMRLTQVN